MDIVNMLSVGSIYQNIAFYSFLVFLGYLNLELARHGKQLKRFRSTNPNR
jgi:hypothetical protein